MNLGDITLGEFMEHFEKEYNLEINKKNGFRQRSVIIYYLKQVPKIMSTVASRHHNPMQFLLPPRAKKNRILQSRKMPIPA